MIPPNRLVCGYYVCRYGNHRLVARWMPQANHWLIPGHWGGTVPANYFDEILDKVA